jgi:hypothetical protein
MNMLRQLEQFFVGVFAGIGHLIFLLFGKGHRHGPRPVKLVINFRGLTGHNMQNMKANQILSGSLTGADEFGNPTAAVVFDTTPAWTVEDETLLTLTPSADGSTCSVASPVGKLGTTNVDIVGQVNGATLKGTQSVTVLPGDTAEIAIVFTVAPAAAPAAPAAPSA